MSFIHFKKQIIEFNKVVNCKQINFLFFTKFNIKLS